MHEKKTAVVVERVPWGKPFFGLNTTLLLSWGICIGGCGILLGALIGVVTLISTVITNHLRLVLATTGTTLLPVLGAVLVLAVAFLLLNLGGARLKLPELPGLLCFPPGLGFPRLG